MSKIEDENDKLLNSLLKRANELVDNIEEIDKTIKDEIKNFHEKSNKRIEEYKKELEKSRNQAEAAFKKIQQESYGRWEEYEKRMLNNRKEIDDFHEELKTANTISDYERISSKFGLGDLFSNLFEGKATGDSNLQENKKNKLH